jgi:hypothetical protein
MNKLDKVRRHLRDRATETLSDSDALAVAAILDLSTDEDLTALSETWRLNVGSERKPKYKKTKVFFIKPAAGIYYIDSAVRLLRDQAQREGLTE